MKQIKLLPDPPFVNKVDINVIDFPNGYNPPAPGSSAAPGSEDLSEPVINEERLRMKVTCEYSGYDVADLKKRGLDYNGAMVYYSEWLYGIIKYHIAQDWECVEGMDAVMAVISDHIRPYFDEE